MHLKVFATLALVVIVAVSGQLVIINDQNDTHKKNKLPHQLNKSHMNVKNISSSFKLFFH